MNEKMIDSKWLIKKFYSPYFREKSAAIDFLNLNFKCKRYALGRNENTKALLGLIDLEAVVDDFAESGSLWLGKPVINSQQVTAGSIVVNCSMSIAPITAKKRLEALHDVAVISYSDLCRVEQSPLPLPDFVNEARQDVEINNDKYSSIFSLLADGESRRIFNALLAFRLTADYAYMRSFSVRLSDQYFEPFLGPLEDSVFVDCGGFDGDTTKEFSIRYGSYKKIYFFEPSDANMAKAQKQLIGLRDIHFVQKGASNSAGKLSFNPGQGSACSISKTGSVQIDVVPLDDFIDEQVTLIKMDLEGWEMKALEGAKRLIKSDFPVLALAVYHHISDFWKIPEFLLSMQPNYKIYMRHYTEGWSETVMYFVPENHLSDRGK